MYLNWIIENDLIGEFHINESKDGIEKVKSGQMTGRDFLFDYCDGKFWDECLNETGLKFTEKYYSSDEYFVDYTKSLKLNSDTIYQVEDNAENYKLVRAILDKRFYVWNEKNRKRFWEFWK